MYDFSLFLLKNWLPVGVAAILFYSIGLLLAKFIWGRYSQRLSFAVEENLNLASQWSALGASQRDLFKKLRSRWQADRDSWETLLSDNDREILAKDARIEQLTDRLEGSGKNIPTPPVIDERDRERVVELEGLLKERGDEIEDLRDEIENAPQSPLVMKVPATDPSEAENELVRRVQELEQDLIDTHDELHTTRDDYSKQVDLVESLEAKLISKPDPDPNREADTVELEKLRADHSASEFRFTEAAQERKQLSVLLSQRNQETFTSQAELTKVRAENRENTAANTAAIEALKAELFTMEVRATEASSIGKQLSVLLSQRNQETFTLRSVLTKEKSEKEQSLVALSARSNEQNSEVESIGKALEIARINATEQARDIEALSTQLDSRDEEIDLLNAMLVEAETAERRKAQLQAELNDACHEMYDVRSALNDRMDEIDLLEARLDELDEAEEERERLAGAVSEMRHDLSDTKLKLEEATTAATHSAGQMEELDAIIEDRGAEIGDLSSEVRQQRDAIRKLKISIAEQEGELEALTGQSAEIEKKAEAKGALLNARTQRVSDLEMALSERYQEMNTVRMEYDDELKSARYHASRADQLEAELNRRAQAFAESGRQAATSEEALEEANLRIEELTQTVEQSAASITQLEEEMRHLSKEKDDRIKEIDEASQRIDQLENAARTREKELESVSKELAENQKHTKGLDLRIEQLCAEIESAKQEQESSIAAIEEIESIARVRAEELESVSKELAESQDHTKGLDLRIEQLCTEIESAKQEQESSIAAIAEIESIARARAEELESVSKELAENQKHTKGLDLRIEQLCTEIGSAKQEQESSMAAIAEIEDIARVRAEELESVSKELAENQDHTKGLDRRIERISTEIESAKQEQESSKAVIAELEGALKSSDSNTLKLSAKLDEKEHELSQLNEDLSGLRDQLDTRESDLIAAETMSVELRAELEEKIAATVSDHGTIVAAKEGMLAERTAEIEALSDSLAAQEKKLIQFAEQRTQGMGEIEKLREKAGQRSDSIRELQSEISNIMMQRASRDSEISLLKDKLREVEKDLSETMLPASVAEAESETEPSLTSGEDLESVIQASLTAEEEAQSGVSLDDLSEAEAHHAPAIPQEEVVDENTETVTEEGKNDPDTILDDENMVYFDESSAELTQTGTGTIDQFAKSVRRGGRKLTVTIVGYSGPEGTPEYTESLSARRADAVRERLLERGVSQSLVSVQSSGQDRRFSNWRARRVELVLVPQAVAEAVN